MLKESDYYKYSKGGINRIASSMVSLRVRRALFKKFIRVSGIKDSDTVLDVGATADSENVESNFFESLYPFKNKITAVGISDASFLERKYSGLRFVRADAKGLPFHDASYDYIFSNAVIEHVGDETNQLIFIKELIRVAKKGVFISMPNRWFPLESHNSLFLVHWLPKKWFRKVLFLLGRFEYCDDATLNLLSYRQLKRMCLKAGIKPVNIYRNMIFGFTSNLVLYIDKIKVSLNSGNIAGYIINAT